MSTADTFARGVAVPAHTEADRTVLAHPVPARGGNASVHVRHLITDEDHLAEDALDRAAVRQGWIALLALSVIGLIALFGVMIARG